MKTWLEYRDEYRVSGDRVYVERTKIEAPFWSFPLYDQMDIPDEIWLVYGPVVRAYLYNDWTLAGHHYVYPFIKPQEVWIESSSYEEERPALFLRAAIGRFLMREEKLSYLESETIAQAYSVDYMVDQFKTGKLALHSYYPKKNNLTLKYSPPNLVPGATENVELASFKSARAMLEQRRKNLQGKGWDQIFEKLDQVEKDLSNLPL